MAEIACLDIAVIDALGLQTSYNFIVRLFKKLLCPALNPPPCLALPVYISVKIFTGEERSTSQQEDLGKVSLDV